MTIEGPVLVTGSGGCIASWVIAKLVAEGIETIALDLSPENRRPALLMDEASLARVHWVTADIADSQRVAATVADNDVKAIIHLAALQVPFCKADPVAGAQVNVVGTANIFEAARQNGIRRLAYASSVAAHGIGDTPWLNTLYGAYKHCNEEMARVYWNDWQVASIGIRPNVVYGVARDQGMTSLPTVAMLAACAGEAYTIPFSGAIGLLYSDDVAAALIQLVSEDREGARVFDMNGSVATVEACIDAIKAVEPGAQIQCEGEPLPFPGDLDDQPLLEYIGNFRLHALQDGVRDTMMRFRDLLARGVLRYEA